MFPGAGINKRQMEQAMKRMGMQQAEIDAIEVIIRTKDTNIRITNPQVSKINMMGQEVFNISGQIKEEKISAEIQIEEEDIDTVMDQSGVLREVALKTIKECKGDLAEAILKLKK